MNGVRHCTWWTGCRHRSSWRRQWQASSCGSGRPTMAVCWPSRDKAGSAELRRVRRKAWRRRGELAAGSAVAPRHPGREDISGDLAVCETLATAVRSCCWCRMARPISRQAGYSLPDRASSRDRNRVAGGLCKPGRRAGRSWSSTEPVFAFNMDRTMAFQMSQFEETVLTTTWTRETDGWV